MKLEELQYMATTLAALAWPDDKPGPQLADSLIARLCEETGELARAVRRLGGARWGHDGEVAGTQEEVLDELGDVLFLAARIADLAGVDLTMAGERAVAKMIMRLEASDISVPPEALDGPPEGKCRVCGCTDDAACEGGCHWVEPDLCSRCVEPMADVTPERASA